MSDNKELEKEDMNVAEEEVLTEAAEDVVEAQGEEETPEENNEDKKEKKDPKDEKIAELEDARVRQIAEFENFRKRSEKEKSAMFDMGAKSIVEKILPVVDNFERGIDTISEEDKETPLAQGMIMIYKQLTTELENIGVKPIEAVGKEFNPELHNAVMQSESDEYESGIIDKELQKGYTYRDSVVRHSMVSVVS